MSYMRHAYDDYYLLDNSMKECPVEMPNLVVEVALAHRWTLPQQPANNNGVAPCLTQMSMQDMCCTQVSHVVRHSYVLSKCNR